MNKDLKCCKNVLEAIGKTPMIRLRRLSGNLTTPILVKFEAMNPGGSVKDRVGIAMIENAEACGELKSGGTIIEATAGNTGVGLAMAAAVRGYRCVFVLPDKMSPDKIRLLKAFGAEVVITPSSVQPDSPESYNGVADRLTREIPNAWRPNQFGNLANPDAHYRTTGPEIWEQTGGKITAFVAGAGTGGTLSGVGKFLKEMNPRIRIIGADPEGSILSGGNPAPYKVEGIGEDFVPKTLNAQVVDEWIRVSDAESFDISRRLAREEGILCGGSSGTALGASLRYAQRLSADDLLVALLPDTGRNYLERFFDDEWMEKNGFAKRIQQSLTIGEVLSRKKPCEVIFVKPHDKVSTAIKLMRDFGFSQLPVIDKGCSVGALHEVTIAKQLHHGGDPEKILVESAMARPLPVLNPGVDIEEAYRLLLSG
ncbi:pyridoxal-phosphate dependent enzyme, partial [bacterium]|nr:pyridoxal-phosphate dependent enzyme [bacterium]